MTVPTIPHVNYTLARATRKPVAPTCNPPSADAIETPGTGIVNQHPRVVLTARGRRGVE